MVREVDSVELTEIAPEEMYICHWSKLVMMLIVHTW